MSLPFLPPLLYSQFLDKCKVLLLTLIHYSFGKIYENPTQWECHTQRSKILKVHFCRYSFSVHKYFFSIFNISYFNLAWVIKYTVLHNRW